MGSGAVARRVRAEGERDVARALGVRACRRLETAASVGIPGRIRGAENKLENWLPNVPPPVPARAGIRFDGPLAVETLDGRPALRGTLRVAAPIVILPFLQVRLEGAAGFAAEANSRSSMHLGWLPRGAYRFSASSAFLASASCANRDRSTLG